MDTKKVFFSTIAVGAAGAAILADKDKRHKAVIKANSIRNKIMGDQDELPIKEAAQPEPYDIEKNKMLAEGSTYGVQYYNKVKQEA